MRDRFTICLQLALALLRQVISQPELVKMFDPEKFLDLIEALGRGGVSARKSIAALLEAPEAYPAGTETELTKGFAQLKTLIEEYEL